MSQIVTFSYFPSAISSNLKLTQSLQTPPPTTDVDAQGRTSSPTHVGTQGRTSSPAFLGTLSTSWSTASDITVAISLLFSSPGQRCSPYVKGSGCHSNFYQLFLPFVPAPSSLSLCWILQVFKMLRSLPQTKTINPPLTLRIPHYPLSLFLGSLRCLKSQFPLPHGSSSAPSPPAWLLPPPFHGDGFPQGHHQYPVAKCDQLLW